MSSEEALLAVVNELANDCLGADWFEVRDRIEKWWDEDPTKGREFIHYARLLLEAWDHA